MAEPITSGGTCLMNVWISVGKDEGLTTAECCPTVDLSAEDTEERVLAVAHDAVRDPSHPWRRDVTWNASRRRCESDDVSPDQAGEKLISRCPMSSTLWRCRCFCTSTEQWTSRLCAGDGVSNLYEELVCVPEACDVRVTVAAILKEKLALKSPDVVDAAVWNPVTGRTPVRTNSENASERLCSQFECVGTPARMMIATRRSSSEVKCSSAFFFATCPLRRRVERSWTALAFRPQEKLPTRE